MAIGVKVLERPIAQTSYVRASLQGMVPRSAICCGRCRRR
jgi:hypothetical protein